MQDEQQQYALQCDWEPCNKQLVHFCFVCDTNNKYYCDSIPCERDLKDPDPQLLVLQ